MKQVRNTMLHEIAHALVGPSKERGGRAHDDTWKACAREIGCNGRRCSKTMWQKTITTRFEIRCLKGCFSSGKHRLPRADGRKCRKCGSQLEVLCNGKPCTGAKKKSKCWELN